MAQLQQSSNQQHLQQHALSGQSLNNSAHNLQQDKMLGAGGLAGDGSMSHSFRGNDQVRFILLVLIKFYSAMFTPQYSISYGGVDDFLVCQYTEG